MGLFSGLGASLGISGTKDKRKVTTDSLVNQDILNKFLGQETFQQLFAGAGGATAAIGSARGAAFRFHGDGVRGRLDADDRAADRELDIFIFPHTVDVFAGDCHRRVHLLPVLQGRPARHLLAQPAHPAH